MCSSWADRTMEAEIVKNRHKLITSKACPKIGRELGDVWTSSVCIQTGGNRRKEGWMLHDSLN